MHCEGAGEPIQIGANSETEQMRSRIKRSRIRIQFQKDSGLDLQAKSPRIGIKAQVARIKDQGLGQELRNEGQGF